MPTLTYLGDEYSCATAIKGADYIHLLDESGVMIAAFDEIKDFSGFKLTNGSYTSPTADHDCYLAVLRDDGTIARGGHKCSDISNMTAADVGVSNTNLLRNWYFSKPVNQRSQRVYARTSVNDTRTFTVDGWSIRNGACTVTLEDDGLLLESNSTTYDAYFEQYIEPTLTGSAVSFSVLADIIEGESSIFVAYGEGGTSTSVKLNDGLTFTTFSNGKSIKRVSVIVRKGSKLKLQAAKLEYDSVQTLAHKDGEAWKLNETPNYDEELSKCCMSTVDELDYFANHYRLTSKDLGTLSITHSTLVDEMISVAKSYYEQDALQYRTNGERYFEYKDGLTCFYSDTADNEFYEGKNSIDCSTFVGLILRGIPYSKSPYATSTDERRNWDCDNIPANTEDYCWAVNPFDWQAIGTSGNKIKVRTAAHLCRWLMSLGCAVSFNGDFSNVEPGDIIFYASNTNSGFNNPDRFMGISHVALCATKETVTDDDTDFAGYPFKHQIYESTWVSGTNNRTFFYDDAKAEEGEVVSNRYLETRSPQTVIAVCRPRFLENINGRVKPIAEGGTGATNASQALANLGALNKNGDTMTGDLTIRKTNNDAPRLILDRGASGAEVRLSSLENSAVLQAKEGGATAFRQLRLASTKKAPAGSLKDVLQIYSTVSGEGTKTVLHTGNITENGVAKIETGSYVGTGTSGEDYPTEITLGFVPKMFWILERGCSPTGRDGHGYAFPCVGLTASYSTVHTKPSLDSYVDTTKKAKLDGMTFSFYCVEGGRKYDEDYDEYYYAYAAEQMNNSGKTYDYMAIG